MGNGGTVTSMAVRFFNKRAQLFTLIAFLLLTFLFLTVEIYSFIDANDSKMTRVETMNSFLHGLEENLERQLYITGFRIIFLAETQIVANGSYIDVDSFFDEAFFNGTVNGQENNTFLTGVTYDDILLSINEKAQKINVNISLENTVITVDQSDPWFVDFTMTSDFVMRDSEGLANWSKVQTISAQIPIVGFEDPFYTLNTNAKVSRKINRTEFEGNYVSGSDVSNLYAHVANGYFAANPAAPSFLHRLEGNFSADEYGIESFVNIAQLSSQGISTKTKSTIDYIYFSGSDPIYYSVPSMQAWFLIDDESNHLTKYNVSAIAV